MFDRVRSLAGLMAGLGAITWVPLAAADTPTIPGAVQIDRDTYRDRLHGLWLAESIATWTGLRSEGRALVPPFPTDATWGGDIGRGTLEFVVTLDPWPADDDTDIEYVLADLMVENASPVLDPVLLREAWVDHINGFIWVSNERARQLMDRGLVPPETSVPAANPFWLAIDAQLTTELMGAMAPGMPGLALELAEPAIATAAGGHAAHASQFFVVCYSLGAVRGPDAATPAGVEALVVDALAYLPPESKAADAIQFVLDDYRANPDLTDWERTRDLVYERYQLNAPANGFRYRGWTESTINLATAVICLLYGQGDLKETIRIGTLTGWDSDNPTATMGGLIGLMIGVEAVREAFNDVTPAPLSDRYWVLRTRDALPDYLPDDPEAEDTFAMLSARLLPIVDVAVGMGGGVRDPRGWVIPPQPMANPAVDNPRVARGLASAIHRVRAAGGSVTATSSAAGPTSPPSGGSTARFYMVTGFEHDPLGLDVTIVANESYFSSEGAGTPPGGEVTLTFNATLPVAMQTLRFIEGDHSAAGGWFGSLVFEVKVGGVWQPAVGTLSRAPDPARPFEILDFTLASPVVAESFRVRGPAGGAGAYVTCAELDAFGPVATRPRSGWDITGDLWVDIEDLYSWHAGPVDLTGDGLADPDDADLLERAIRWFEREPRTD